MTDEQPVVRLVPVEPHDSALRAAVSALRPRPDQEVFSATAEQTLPAADADPRRTPFAVLAAGRPVGFGVLDRGGYLDELVDEPHRAVLLRAFYLDAAAQGRGLGTAAARAVPGLAARLYPDAELLVLTVNERNAAAAAAYRRAGFADTGARYLGGDAGPQHVLVAALPCRAAGLPPALRSARWHDGTAFHGARAPVYTGPTPHHRWYKHGEHMAHVRYEPSHPNAEYDDSRAGTGTTYCVWVAGEQDEQAEGISASCLDGVLDTYLEPGASIGWHLHESTEEIYYLLDGGLDVRMEDDTGTAHRCALRPGDSHRVGPGMWHGAQAGPQGARFVTVMLKVPPRGAQR